MKNLLTTVALALGALIGQAEVLINEIMADNGGKYSNVAGEAMDWLELYNSGSSPVDLTGWRITDTVEDKWSKWKEIPAGTIVPAQGYLLLWGHNKDFPTPEDAKGFCGVTNGEVHVKLGMSSKGETITLAASEADYNATNFADQVTFGAQFADVSYGRDPGDTAKWLFFTNATPGAANGADGLEKYPPEEEQGGEEPGSGGDEDIDGPHEGEFAVMLDVSRPVAGKAMKATVTGEPTGNVSFAWFVREPAGAYGDALCEGREYTPTAANYEHWIRVVATDEGGTTASAEFYFSKLPIVYINTDDGKAVTSKVEYKGATIRIQGNDLYDQQYDGKTEIKGRGNSSWGFPKKPYKLKLDKKADLFGFGKNKHWVLISNWLDVCGMRNWMASALAKELGIIGMDMTWVQVVLNGSYNGTYMLCEHIRVDENRVDVFDWSDTIESDGHSEEDLSWLDAEDGMDFSGGYIFELDARYDEVSKFTTANGLKVMFNTPEFASTSQKMMAYAGTMWGDLEDGYRSEDGFNGSGVHYSQVADMDSMAAFWLVNEMMANNDSICYSRYAHKDRGGLLAFGPVWDFDVATASMKMNNITNPVVWTACQWDSRQNLFRDWADDPFFCLKLLEKYWRDVRPWMMELLNDGCYDDCIAYQREAGVANDKRWNRENQYETPADMQHPRSFAGELGDAAVVKDFLRKRIEWLDRQFLSVDALVESVRVAKSAYPYVKDDATLELVLENADKASASGATTDFILERDEKAPQVKVTVANDVIAKLHAYVNGLKYGIYDVADGKCEFTVSADKMVAERGHRDMVSLIAKDAGGNTIARNYLTILNPPIPPVTVTEIMADNGGSYPNAAGEAMDWLELYNPGATPVDLTGWRITDTVEDEWSKWKEIPAGTTVPAGGYLLLWGHNKDFPTPDDKKGFCGVTNGEVHVKLGMSSKGETITLAASEADYNATNFADQVTFGAQFADVSYGRDPGDTAKWLFFTNATPGAANGSDGLEKYPPEEEQGGDDDPGDVSGDTELETKLLKIGLPVVVIDTVGQEEPTFDVVSSPSNPNTKAIRNATKVPGRLRIKVGNETTYDSGEYEKKKSGMTVKVRGNSSALMSGKKPYKIKLQAAADLLCRGNDEKFEDKEWVLLTETGDLLNTVAFKVNELLGLQWTPSYRYVNVVMNGDYRGLYQLIEAESRNENCRIDVAEDGYLFEWDGYWWNEDVSFTTPSAGMGWTFKYPDSDDVTEEQVESLSNSIRRVENAIYGPYRDPAYKYTQYPALIDVESWAAWLLGHDIMGTWDAAGSNVYMTKYDDNPNTKIVMANMWDFNTCFMMKDEWPRIRGWNYFKFLIQSHNHAFNNAWMRKWRRLRGHLLDDIDKTLGEMETSGLAAAIDASRVLDGERWSGTRNLFADDRKTVEDWFSSRIAWIDAHIGEMATDPEVVINEVMADNGGSYTNADGNASDWIELYNAGAADADISGWRLCDSTTKKWSKWEELPEGTVVPAGGYLIVWADDFTGWTNGEVHVNLGFSSKGEEVALAIAEGEIVDSFAFGPQHTDVSFGRDPSDPEKLVYFKAPTPGAANGNDGIENGDSFNISINELMAENGGKFPNAAGEAMDWLELYNAGAADVDVSGWGFQDDPTKAWSKWKTLPEGAVVPAGGYLLVWGDNKDFNSFTGITNGEVHVNMGLSKKGEGLHLALTNGVGTVVRIDGFDFPKQAPDVSWGRTASDPGKFLYFTEPTPAAANGDVGREALVFAIGFDSNGGTPVASVAKDYDAAISALTAPTRTGYTFAGWYESGAAEPFVFSTMPARDVALAAHWTANVYTVVYDPNGGEGAPVTNAAVYDSEFGVADCSFAKIGYAFAGWAMNATGEVAYADGATVSNLTAVADATVTLYAVWDVTDLVDSLETHVDVEKGEVAPFETAAAVYDGFLYDGGRLVGSVQVKFARGKTDKRGAFSSKVTATVQLAGEAKKLIFKDGFADATGKVTDMTDKNGNMLAVTVGVKGLGGEFRRSRGGTPYRIDGARNVFGGKSEADKADAEKAMERYQDTYNVAFDGGTLSISVDKKGKTKIAGTVKGNKVSATSQLVVGKDAAVVPVVIAKKVNVAFCLWVMADGTVEVRGVDPVTSGEDAASPFLAVGKAETIADGAKFSLDDEAVGKLKGWFTGLYADYLPKGLAVAQDGKKWIVADGAKAGKLVLDKTTASLNREKSKFTGNMAGLKLTYRGKDGTFKGSFKVYNLEDGNKIRVYAANVTGVLIGAKGYGTATIKKLAYTFVVTIE